jgi:hypothetical protein
MEQMVADGSEKGISEKGISKPKPTIIALKTVNVLDKENSNG